MCPLSIRTKTPQSQVLAPLTRQGKEHAPLTSSLTGREALAGLERGGRRSVEGLETRVQDKEGAGRGALPRTGGLEARGLLPPTEAAGHGPGAGLTPYGLATVAAVPCGGVV